MTDPLSTRPIDPTTAPVTAKRSSWPVLIILLAGLVLALLVWLPAEMSSNTSDTAVQPAPSSETATPPPADNAVAPSATVPAPAPATPATPPAAETTTPPATNTAPAPAAPAN